MRSKKQFRKNWKNWNSRYWWLMMTRRLVVGSFVTVLVGGVGIFVLGLTLIGGFAIWGPQQDRITIETAPGEPTRWVVIDEDGHQWCKQALLLPPTFEEEPKEHVDEQ